DKYDNTIGKGSYLKSIILDDKTVFYIWEQDRQIKFHKAE
ncbi:MAG: hypothetical protein ACI9UV_001319, partial [Algoriphagus sp.]